MKGLLLLIVFGCALLSYAAITAANTNVSVEGYNWATRFCSSAHGICQYPHELAYAAVGFGVIWLLTLIMK
jgi:hypothetical protein